LKTIDDPTQEEEGREKIEKKEASQGAVLTIEDESDQA